MITLDMAKNFESMENKTKKCFRYIFSKEISTVCYRYLYQCNEMLIFESFLNILCTTEHQILMLQKSSLKSNHTIKQNAQMCETHCKIPYRKSIDLKKSVRGARSEVTFLYECF